LSAAGMVKRRARGIHCASASTFMVGLLGKLPLRDAAGENIGLIVLTCKNADKSGKTDKDFFVAGTKLRDDPEKDIPSFAALFEPVK
jgi:hypothetical protein